MTTELRSWSPAQLREVFSDLPPRTADDVSITADGQRLDSVEAVQAFLAELACLPSALRSTAQLVPPAQQGGAGVNLDCLGVGPYMSVGVDDVVTVAH